MSRGFTVAAGVVVALALYETILPRAFAALRRWKRTREKREEAPRLSSSANDSTLAFSDCGVGVTEKGDKSKVAHPRQIASRAASQGDASLATSENSKSAYRERDLRSKEERDVEAWRLWKEARGMMHRFTPDWEADRDYLAKVYGAARLGHFEAMAKLGEYAGRRGAVVEAYYWTLLAELKGATGLGVVLREMRVRWLLEGCPGEYENAYGDFTEEQGVFARSVLRLQCGVDPQYARARLNELAEFGVEEARLFLRKGNASPK